MTILHRVVRFLGLLWIVLVVDEDDTVILYHPKRHFWDKDQYQVLPISKLLTLLGENKIGDFTYSDGHLYRVTERVGRFIVATADPTPERKHRRWLITTETQLLAWINREVADVAAA